MACNDWGEDQCTGGTCFESSHYTTLVCANAFDDTGSTLWGSDSADTAWLGYEFAAAQNIEKISITSHDSEGGDRSPTSFELRAANSVPGDGSSEGTVLLTVEEAGDLWGTSTTESWEFDNSNSYTCYWIYMYDKYGAFGKGSEYMLDEVEMFECLYFDPNEWANKLILTIDSSKVDQDLTNFPVLITLSSGTGITNFDTTDVFDVLATSSGSYVNRKKIAITTTVSGVETELYTEIEGWDSPNYSFDLTSISYTHYANNGYGDPLNMSDNNLSTYCQQYTYCAIDFGSGNEKIISKARFAVHNSTALATILGQEFQGSNDSTDGSDGTWDNLITFTAGNFGTPPSYPGFGNWITISGADTYQMYRLTGEYITNNVTNEWEMLEETIPCACLWTKVPTVTSGTDTTLYLYYDSNQADNTSYIGDTGDTPAQNVWDEYFLAVYHMVDNPGNQSTKDSTSNVNDGTKGSANNPTETDSIIGKGQLYDADEYIDIGDIDIDGNGTIESMGNPDIITGTKFILSRINSGGTNTTHDISFSIKDSVLRVDLGDNVGGYQIYATTLSPTIGSYQYMACKVDGSNITVFLDGSTQSTTQTTTPAGNANPYRIGNRIYYSGAFDGTLDEIRVSTTDRSDSWVKATRYSNWDDILTFSEYVVVTFTFTNPIPLHLSTVYGTSHTLQLTVTCSGEDSPYIYDAKFFDASDDSQIGSTTSGTSSGQSVSTTMQTPIATNYNWYVWATSSGLSDTSSTYIFTNKFKCMGTVKEGEAALTGIPVRLYKRDTGELVGSGISTGISGTFEIITDYNEYYYCVALYASTVSGVDITETNALIYDHLKP